MKRFKQRGTGLAMALGMFAMVANAGETVSSAAGGWFAVDSRDVKDTTLEGGVIVGGKTGIALTSSANAWGEDGAGTSATITWASTSGGSGTVASAMTAEAVAWTPEAKLGTITLTYVSGGVEKTAQFGIEALEAGGDAYAQIKDGVCTIGGTGDTTDENPLASQWASVKEVRITDGVTGIGTYFFDRFYNLTNVTVAASCTSLGAGAFYRCFSLEQITFEGAMPTTIGDNALVITAGIKMVDDNPVVYAVPNVTVNGKSMTLKGSNDLQNWEDVTSGNEGDYHFFKFVAE